MYQYFLYVYTEHWWVLFVCEQEHWLWFGINGGLSVVWLDTGHLVCHTAHVPYRGGDMALSSHPGGRPASVRCPGCQSPLSDWSSPPLPGHPTHTQVPMLLSHTHYPVSLHPSTLYLSTDHPQKFLPLTSLGTPSRELAPSFPNHKISINDRCYIEILKFRITCQVFFHKLEPCRVAIGGR